MFPPSSSSWLQNRRCGSSLTRRLPEERDYQRKNALKKDWLLDRSITHQLRRGKLLDVRTKTMLDKYLLPTSTGIWCHTIPNQVSPGVTDLNKRREALRWRAR